MLKNAKNAKNAVYLYAHNILQILENSKNEEENSIFKNQQLYLKSFCDALVAALDNKSRSSVSKQSSSKS